MVSVAAQELNNVSSLVSDSQPAIVIIGAGPVGIRAAQALLRRDFEQHVVLYGNEPWEPYNRVQLSNLLAGKLAWQQLLDSQKLPPLPNLVQRYNCQVIRIDRYLKQVIDQTGHVQPYSKLILATGSRPHVPNIPGIDKPGVFRFRDMSDVEKLLARQSRSRHTVVIGGGVLGIEAARAMHRQNTQVTIIDHSPRLMSQQLDEEAAETLREQLLAMGIKVILSSNLRQVCGEGKVEGVELGQERRISCDTIVLATGIRPNIELAREASLSVGRGVRVNDWMQTSDPDVYAVGECAEHREKVYGLVQPGYEQAEVAVSSVLGKRPRYAGSIATTQLKVLDVPLFSVGRVGEEVNLRNFQEYIHRDARHGQYRKIVMLRGRLVGSIAVGNWDESARIQEAIQQGRFVWPWQIKRFLKHGRIWDVETIGSINQWPAAAKVCQCTGVTRGQLSSALKAGHTSLPSLMAVTGASSVCGSCRPLLVQMLGSNEPLEPVRGARTLLLLGLLVVFLSLSALAMPAVSYNSTVQAYLQWDLLWRDNLLKQVSGYSVLGLSLLAMLMSLRKRVNWFGLSSFPVWRLVHVCVAFLGLAALALHTGFHLGSNLNFLLMLGFVGMLAMGGLAAVIVGTEHCMDGVNGRRLRKTLVWSHILLFWPLPVLLIFHVLKSYYF